MHGKFLKKTLQKEGINTDAIVEDNLLPFHALNICAVKNPAMCGNYLQMVLSLKE